MMDQLAEMRLATGPSRWASAVPFCPMMEAHPTSENVVILYYLDDVQISNEELNRT
jgi:hypothetical protein